MLSRRQARWSQILSSYDFQIKHLEGAKNPADGQSRRPEYEIGYERPIGRFLATATCTEDHHDDLIVAIHEAQKYDRLAQDMNGTGTTTGTGGTTGKGGTTGTASTDSTAGK